MNNEKILGFVDSARRDWLVMGAAAGGVAALLRATLDELFYRTGVSDTQFPEIAGGAVLGQRAGEKPRTWAEYGLGLAADITLGSTFGATLAYLLTRTPQKHYALKGAAYGMGLWTTSLALGSLLRIDGLANPSAKSMAALLVTTVAFGGLTGAILEVAGKKITRTQAVPLKVDPVSRGDTPRRRGTRRARRLGGTPLQLRTG